MKISVTLFLALLLIGCATTPHNPRQIVLVQPIAAGNVSFDDYINKLNEIVGYIRNYYMDDTCFAQIKNHADSILYVQYYKQQGKVRKYTSWKIPAIVTGELIYHRDDVWIATITAGMLYMGSLFVEKIIVDFCLHKRVSVADIKECNNIVESYNATVLRNYYHPFSKP